MNTTPPAPATTDAAHFTGLIAATFTPFDSKDEVNFDLIPKLIDHLDRNEIAGIYICGSTGEGPSLTMEERKAVAEAHIEANRNRMRAIVNIGHTCLRDAQTLGAHAESIGADAIAAIAPYYFKPENLSILIAFLKEVAASAPTLPFYYYHIPSLTGRIVDPVEFLEQARESIPTLAGIKFTDTDLSVFNACQDVDNERLEVYFGRDEMLLSGLAAGARGAIGSTYNLAPALYQQIIRSFETGDLENARMWQRKSVQMIRTLISAGGEAAMKYPMRRLGLDCGPRRLPMRQLSASEMKEIDRELDASGFDQWASK